ncbi:FAD-binding protein [Polymorphospora rubra]|uniref:FAD-binding protein n=1 Tax=Polymorphospora rubra TaxID=338584 RepID=UPI0033C6C35B
METNWAGNHTYRAAGVCEPASVDELREVVARENRVRALGSRHSFTDIGDTAGLLVSLAGLPADVEIDPDRRQVTVGGGARYGEVAEALHAKGWALANLASLPHISVAGAVATGTHGSGDRNGSLATAVAAVEIVGPDGAVRRLTRADPDFDGSVVALGALGIVARLTLDIEPAYDVRQTVYTGLSWDAVLADLDAVTAGAYSVSLFTDWVGDRVDQVWLKSRAGEPPADFFGATRADATRHMLAGADVAAVTGQHGVPGPWHERLPHFRMAFTPSRGEELQSEYLVPRRHAATAITELRRLGPRLAPVLQVGEIRTVAADRLWLSGAYGTDVVALHFTWVRDTPAVYGVLPAIEAALLPLGARPHWGKCFVASGAQLRAVYPRLDDFTRLRDRVDPTGKFGNALLDRVLAPAAASRHGVRS